MYYNNFLLSFSSLLLLLSLGSCKKESILPDSLRDVVYTCPEGEADAFFKGYIDGKKVCFKEGIMDYKVAAGLVSAFTTSGHTLELGGDYDSLENFNVRGYVGMRPTATQSTGHGAIKKPPNHTPSIEIRGPKAMNSVRGSAESESDSWGTQFFERHFGEEGALPLGDEEQGGYRVLLKYNGQKHSFRFSTYGGDQEGSYLNLVQVEKAAYQGKTQYHLVFEFSCNLYYAGTGKHTGETVYYETIEDGLLDVTFVL